MSVGIDDVVSATHNPAPFGLNGEVRRPNARLVLRDAMPRNGSCQPRSVEAVKAYGASRHDPLRYLRRCPFEAIQQHFRRTREEPVGVWVIGGPQNFVGTDIVGQHLEATLDRFERDPAIAAEQLAGTRLEAGIVESLVVEMAVHPVEPRRDPAAT